MALASTKDCNRIKAYRSCQVHLARRSTTDLRTTSRLRRGCGYRSRCSRHRWLPTCPRLWRQWWLSARGRNCGFRLGCNWWRGRFRRDWRRPRCAVRFARGFRCSRWRTPSRGWRRCNGLGFRRDELQIVMRRPTFFSPSPYTPPTCGNAFNVAVNLTPKHAPFASCSSNSTTSPLVRLISPSCPAKS